MQILGWLIVAWLVDRAQIKITGATYGNAYCGSGTIDGVNNRTIEAPMAYRVLVPWLVGLAERLFPAMRPHRIAALYEPLKIICMAYAYWAVSLALGAPAALLVAALTPMTFLFDYWDWAIELGGLALALTGDYRLALLGAALLGMSRETAPLVGVAYALTTGDWLGGFYVVATAVVTQGLVHLWVQDGWTPKPMYCSRWMVRQNWLDLKRIMASSPVYMGEMSMTLALTILTVASVALLATPTWPVPLALLVMGWTMARAPETRVFTGCLLWVAPLLLKAVGYG